MTRLPVVRGDRRRWAIQRAGAAQPGDRHQIGMLRHRVQERRRAVAAIVDLDAQRVVKGQALVGQQRRHLRHRDREFALLGADAPPDERYDPGRFDAR